MLKTTSHLMIGAAALVTAALTAQPVLASACASEKGARQDMMLEAGGYQASVLEELDLFGTAGLTEGNCTRDCYDEGEAYTVSLERTDKAWTFAFKRKAGGEGTLSMPAPKEVNYFAIDPTHGSGPGWATLYKELRYSGPVTGTGQFSDAPKGAKMTFVLTGSGNDCPDAGQFRKWFLHITGGDVDRVFYGGLKYK